LKETRKRERNQNNVRALTYSCCNVPRLVPKDCRIITKKNEEESKRIWKVKPKY
jgi:hypothetical protein